jgi:hypothetical protein
VTVSWVRILDLILMSGGVTISTSLMVSRVPSPAKMPTPEMYPCGGTCRPWHTPNDVLPASCACVWFVVCESFRQREKERDMAHLGCNLRP